MDIQQVNSLPLMERKYILLCLSEFEVAGLLDVVQTQLQNTEDSLVALSSAIYSRENLTYEKSEPTSSSEQSFPLSPSNVSSGDSTPRRAPLKMGMSLFVDEYGNLMPSNADAVAKWSSRYLRNLPTFRKKYDWTIQHWQHSEDETLDRLVHENLRQWLLDKFHIHPDPYLVSASGLTEKDIHSKQDFALMLAIQKMFSLLQELNHSPESLDNFWKSFWNSISTQLGGKIIRSGKECSTYWMKIIEERCNQKVWDKDEDDHLSKIASQHNYHDWWQIAANHGYNRTPLACLTRYQRYLTRHSFKLNWDAEEDEQLRQIVMETGLSLTGPCKWNHVAAHFPGRTNAQCRSRWYHSIQENLKHGFFSPLEDIKLQLLVSAYGRGNWTKVAQHLEGRTDMKCRERYENVLYPRLKKGAWTKEENSRLLEGIQKYGYKKWSSIR
ncbi:Myb family Dna-binding domain-containing protein, partial [Cardiosporidium cionae]